MLPTHVPGEDIPEVNELVEVETMLAERVKEWTTEWKEDGLQKGIQKGKLQLLNRQLTTKFGQLP